MKKIQIWSLLVLIIALAIICINIFITPLTDWIVRVSGILMLIMIFAVSYSTFKNHKEKDIK